MADLDEFFAKFDQKKKSKLKNNMNGTMIFQRQANAAGQVKKSQVRKQSVGEQTEDEWYDYALPLKPKPKDYTGLKITQLNFTEKHVKRMTLLTAGKKRLSLGGNKQAVSKLNNANASMTDDDSDDSPNSGSGKSSSVKVAAPMPWRPIGLQENNEQQVFYYAKETRGGSRKKAKDSNDAGSAPDISDLDYFPTLQAAHPSEWRKKKNEGRYHRVKHGFRRFSIDELFADSQCHLDNTNRFQLFLDEDEDFVSDDDES